MDGRNKTVSTLMNEIRLHETIYAQTTLTLIEIQDEEGYDNTKEVGRAWIGRYDIDCAYDVAVYEAGTDTTD